MTEMVRISLHNDSVLDSEQRSLPEAIEWLNEMLERVPHEYRDATVFEIEHDSGYYDSGASTTVRVFYDRPITSAEIAARQQEQEAYRARSAAEQQEREIATLRALKKKYGE